MRVNNETVGRSANKIKGIAGNQSEFGGVMNIQNTEVVRIYYFRGIGDVLIGPFLNDHLDHHGRCDVAQWTEKGVAMSCQHKISQATGICCAAYVPHPPAQAGRIVIGEDGHDQVQTGDF